MYNIIFSMVDIRDSLTEEQGEYFNSHFDFVDEVPHSRKVDGRILYQGNVSCVEEMMTLEGTLASLGGSPSIIGVWEESGLQQGYRYENIGTDDEPIIEIVRNTVIDDEGNEILEDIIHPFELSEYIHYLRDIVEYDEEGNEVSRTRPTVATQVNTFSGYTKRNLDIL